ncbi:MAG TPA: glycine--tRNA ligase subunit beta [Dissulfurispiraceae bacterium]|nr:glycine--tRNA ligase subunit beta [Dissulfurispiraceae bacterium]
MTINNHAPKTINSAALLIFEIGTEEIPARFLSEAIVKIQESAEKLFSEYRILTHDLRALATPRRLSMIVELQRTQTASQKDVWGPPENVAFDKDGKPTKAAEAFARNNGIDIGDIAVKEKGKGRYVFASVKESSASTAEVLPDLLPKLLTSLHFPKAMRWGSGDFRFVRPVHWILSIYDNQKVQFEFEGLTSGNTTRGHRFLSPAAFEIKDAKTYINLLRNNFVILDPMERRKMISDGTTKLAASVNGIMVEDEELMNHVMYLIEYPVPMLGAFPSEYLSLPKELLVTVMKDHQKYFALEDGRGSLVNNFIVVSNTRLDNTDTVRKGAEKVIKARFEDARFYFEEDKKVPLVSRLEGLKNVVFHDRLGSIHEKCIRASALAAFIASKCCPDRKEDARTAALLSKADLISGVVREFPELQGIMGHYYALNEGRRREVSVAIKEQYLPRFSGDSLPESITGAIVSLADKLDNIASFFMIGMAPSGTEDPFALRRQTIGALLILIDKHFNISLADLLPEVLKPYDVMEKDNIIGSIIRFFEQRFDPIFQPAGYSADVIASITPFIGSEPLFMVKEKMDALMRLKSYSDYEGFLLMMKRINNIAPKAAASEINKSLLALDEEKSLHNAVERATPLIADCIKDEKYLEAVDVLITLKDVVNNFFDKVLIMDKNEEIKQNRLALLKSVQALGLRIADFSKLT